MSPRPPVQHLGEIVSQLGTGKGTKAIVDLIETQLHQEQAEEQDRRKAEGKGGPRLYVTDVGRCPASVWNRLMEVPETQPLTTDSLVNFRVGHAVEEAFMSLVGVEGVVCREIPLTLRAGDAIVYGRADFMLLNNVLVELKSISSRSMGWTLKREENGRPEHNSQANLYLRASQEGTLGDETMGAFPLLDLAYLVYVVKDSTKGEPVVHAFEVPYSPRKAMEDLEFFAGIWWDFERGVQPICDCEKRFNKKGPLYCAWGPSFPCCEREA